MSSLELSPADLTQVRFVMSPMSQLLGALLVLGGRHQPAGMGRWRHNVWGRYRAACADQPTLLALVQTLDTTAYMPDFLTVPAGGMDTTFRDELEAVRKTPDAIARSDLAVSATVRRDRAVGQLDSRFDTPSVSALVADALEAAWEALLLPDWARLRALLERDVVHRSRMLSTAGLGPTLGPSVSISACTLRT
jgi:hypothetical protein